jgi:predicted RND superfamily exporter protein
VALSDDIEARVRRAVVRALGLAVAAALLATAAGFLLAALYLALRTAMEPLFACLVTAGVLLLIVAIVLMLSGRAAVPRSAAAPGQPAADPVLAAMRAGEQLAGTTQRWLGQHRLETVIGLFACGFAIGFSSRLRRGLLRWLRG